MVCLMSITQSSQVHVSHLTAFTFRTSSEKASLLVDLGTRNFLFGWQSRKQNTKIILNLAHQVISQPEKATILFPLSGCFLPSFHSVFSHQTSSKADQVQCKATQASVTSLFLTSKKNTKVRLNLYQETSFRKGYIGYKNRDCPQIKLFNFLILKLSINYQSILVILHKTFIEYLLRY